MICCDQISPRTAIPRMCVPEQPYMSAASVVEQSFFAGSLTGIFMAPECRDATLLINTICQPTLPPRMVGTGELHPAGLEPATFGSVDRCPTATVGHTYRNRGQMFTEP